MFCLFVYGDYGNCFIWENMWCVMIKREFVKIMWRIVYIRLKFLWKWIDNGSGFENGDMWFVIGKLVIVSE